MYWLDLLSCRLSGKSFPLFLELYFTGVFFKSMDRRKDFCLFFSGQRKCLTHSIQHAVSHYAWIFWFSHSHFKIVLPTCSLWSQRSAFCQVRGRHQLFVKSLQIMYSTCFAARSSTASATDFKYSLNCSIWRVRKTLFLSKK